MLPEDAAFKKKAGWNLVGHSDWVFRDGRPGGQSSVYGRVCHAALEIHLTHCRVWPPVNTVAGVEKAG